MELELQILWLEKSIGFSINLSKNNKIIPITSYYFWPRNDAWKQLKLELDSKSWIPVQKKIIILNCVSTTMQYWKNYKKRENSNFLFKIKEGQNLKLIGIS